MADRLFYYVPADYTACAEHMAKALGDWFPEVGEQCKGPLWNYEGWDIDELINALKEAEELGEHNFEEVYDVDGDIADHCMSLH